MEKSVLTISANNLTDKELIRYTEIALDKTVPLDWALELARRLEARNDRIEELETGSNE